MTEETSQTEVDVLAFARRMTYRPEKRLELFNSLSLPAKSAVFNILSPVIRQEILDAVSFNDAVDLLDHLDPRRVHHILSKMKDKKRRDRLLGRIKADQYEKIDYFLRFHPQATVSLIHLNYVYLPDTTTIGDTAVVIEDHLRNTGKIPVILINHDGELIGEVPLNTLVRERNTAKLKNYVRPVKLVPYNAERQDVLSLFMASPHAKVVVTDNDGSVLGVVYSDDVIDLLDLQPAVSLFSFANVESSERPFDDMWSKVKSRYRWLVINLATCFLAAGVVKVFDGTVDALVILAVFMPIVAGMGGNAATQTLAVMVRGITVGEITLKNSKKAVINEVLAGGINGLITGVILIPVALLLGVDFSVALIGAAAVVFGLVIAGFFGAVIPLVLKHLGKDPATSAGILISTATDVLGFLFLLGAATFFLL